MRVSVLIGTRDRPALLLRCIKSIVMQDYPDMEIVVLDDASSRPVPQEQIKAAAGTVPLHCLRSEEQLGLNKTRNTLIDAAAGDVFFIIDDDAFFDSKTALQLVVDAFNHNDDLGIIATKILDSRSGRVRPLTPHSRRHLRQDPALIDDTHLTSYFLGGAHAIRKSVIEQCGNYDEILMYGLDEIELAYRVLEKGFCIQYLPEIVVHHQPPDQPVDKKTGFDWRLYYLTRNRILFAYKHLPLLYTLTYIPSWLGWYGYKALRTGVLSSYFKGISDAYGALPQVKRKPISNQTKGYLKANFGRLWR